MDPLDFIEKLKKQRAATVLEAYAVYQFKAHRTVDDHEQSLQLIVRDAGPTQPRTRFSITVIDEVSGLSQSFNSGPSIDEAL